MENKKKANWFKITFFALLIIYISLYALNVTGYYDSNLRRKVEFTEEQIAEFERDIAEGNPVDIKDYLKDQTKDYTNNVSNFGYRLSVQIDAIFNRGITGLLKILSKLLS